MDHGDVMVNDVEQLAGVTEGQLEVSHSPVEVSDQVERTLGGQVQEEGRRSGVGNFTDIREFDVSRMWELMWDDRLQCDTVQYEDHEHREEETRRREYEHERQMKHM